MDRQDTSSKHKLNEVEDESANVSAGSVFNFIEPEDTDLTALARFSEITTLFNSLMKNGNVESFVQNSFGHFQFKPKNPFPSLTDQSATLLAIKVADKLIIYSKTSVNQNHYCLI